ncbi:hypothetical protein [Candidatus Nitrosocosmicus sp. SS]|jgi:hypothetical protein|uniref:hypothetical protein n=1 Tax=Candidatus Nitrosocosmicus agrestis TaxID=2563600 RepID=UPI00122E3CD4|nr:hypothetical protein [Candidatus Nitrosocosmicus sp. SS]KAA2282972.1 hypothetical protein F1Z66_04735 [Candidatus Nitrosocosmicus sp. SS]KAF0869175.1 hypothetical protein E5N71_07015 [Candidatus Nitrosocosmicus sp. SS]
MSFVIPVSKKDPNSIEIMHTYLKDQSLYGHVGKYYHFLPKIVCTDCDQNCSYNPIALGMTTPIAVVCGRCDFVYFDHEKQS